METHVKIVKVCNRNLDELRWVVEFVFGLGNKVSVVHGAEQYGRLVRLVVGQAGN